MTKIKNKYPLITLSLILLFNPSANIVDVLPDCIAYILLILAIGGLSETVPYLKEAKDALVKLALLTVVKLPAFTVMYSNMSSGKDIVPLFTLVFVTLELILLYSLVSNVYLTLSYIGERTDCASVRDAFDLNKNKKCTLEQLRFLTYAFFLARGVLNVIPEVFLLTPEETSLRKKLSEAYPVMLVLCITAALIIGIIWLSHVLKYVKAIKKAGDIGEAVEYIASRASTIEIGAAQIIKKLSSSLTLLAASSLFIFDITISDFGSYNILPHFIYGILLFISVYGFANSGPAKKLLTLGAVGYSVSSMIVYLASRRFAESFSYVDLKYSASARSAYSLVKIFSCVELLFAMLMLTFAALATVNLIKEHTDVSPSDPSYSRTNEKNHRLTIRSTLPVFVISAIIHVLKILNVFVKQTSIVIGTAASDEGIVASGMPALDTVIFLASVIYVICTFVKASNLKDEIKFKYEK